MKLARRLQRIARWVGELTKDPRRARFTSALVLGGSGKADLCSLIAHRATCDHDTTIRAFEQIEDAPLPSAFINALIVVVDSSSRDSSKTVAALCRLLPPSLSYACIFVDGTEQNIGGLRETLLDETGAAVEIIHGSPGSGAGVEKLKARLAEIG